MTFRALPLAGLIGEKILCCHGGLHPEGTIDKIDAIQRPFVVKQSV